MKLYIVSYGSGNHIGEGTYYLIAETGEALYSHFCSNIAYAKDDLLLRRPERIKECTERYGEFTLLMIGQDDMTYEEILKRNKSFRGEEGAK